MKTPSRMIRILAISGSLRQVSSHTAALLNAAIAHATYAQASLTEIITVMSGRLVPEASITVPLAGKNLDAVGIAAHPEISAALKTAILVFATKIGRYRSEAAH
jgi:chromate reductase, NAD(P)H dehydrogenase (quinone)